MSHYIFKPMPSNGYGDHPFTTWNDAVSKEEVERVLKMADEQEKNIAIVGADRLDSDYRSSKVAWFRYGSDTEWLFDRVAYIVGSLNAQFYGFDLHGLCEDLQFTEYYASENGHYDWHQDSGPNTASPRKMSIVIQLSDPADYEGGDLQILSARDPVNVDKKLGLAAVFPSFMLHRVTPVTKGTRRSLVAWIAGPKFR